MMFPRQLWPDGGGQAAMTAAGAAAAARRQSRGNTSSCQRPTRSAASPAPPLPLALPPLPQASFSPLLQWLPQFAWLPLTEPCCTATRDPGSSRPHWSSHQTGQPEQTGQGNGRVWQVVECHTAPDNRQGMPYNAAAAAADQLPPSNTS